MITMTPQRNCYSTTVLRRLSMYGTVAFMTLCLNGSLLHGAAPLPAFDWWFSARGDNDWTNKSLREIQATAEQGEPSAQYYFGRAWFFGVSGKRDMNESLNWVRRSAEQGYPQAQLLLARFYFLGLVVDRDNDQGLQWTTRAAQQGNADAMALLGLNYEFGEGTPPDAQKALEWLKRAETAGSRVAPKWIGDFYSSGEALTARRTNYVEALRCYQRAASNGLVSAAILVIDMSRKGLGTPPDPAPALYWLRHFADENHPDMLEGLATVYSDGAAEPRNAEDSPTQLIRRAAEIRINQYDRGDWALKSSWALANDCQELWNRYRFGIGTQRDYVASAQWRWQYYREELRRVANARGTFTGGDQDPPNPFDPYLKGQIAALSTDERLWQQAVRIIHQALDEKRSTAWHQIGEHYRDGSKLTPKNPVLAWAWFNPAANSGHAPSKTALDALQKNLTPSELQSARDLWLPSTNRENALNPK